MSLQKWRSSLFATRVLFALVLLMVILVPPAVVPVTAVVVVINYCII